jgi:hypothetical protein
MSPINWRRSLESVFWILAVSFVRDERHQASPFFVLLHVVSVATHFPPRMKLAQEDSATHGTCLPQLPPALLTLLEGATGTNPPPPDSSLLLHLTATHFCRTHPLQRFPNPQVSRSLFSVFAPHPCSVLALCSTKYM